MIVKPLQTAGLLTRDCFFPTDGASVPAGSAWSLAVREEGDFCSPVISVSAASMRELGPGPVPTAGSHPHPAQGAFCLLGLELELPRPSAGEDTGARGAGRGATPRLQLLPQKVADNYLLLPQKDGAAPARYALSPWQVRPPDAHQTLPTSLVRGATTPWGQDPKGEPPPPANAQGM